MTDNDAYRIDVDRIQTGRMADPASLGRRHPKGRFYRPELETPAQRIAGSLTVRVAAVCGLVIAASALIVVAVSSGAIL